MSLVKRGDRWWSHIWVNGVRHRKSTGTSNRRQAETIDRQFYDELNAHRHGLSQEKQDITFAELATRFIGDGMSTPYARDRLNHILPFFSDALIREITTALVRRYRQERQAHNKKLKPATVNRDLSVLRRILNFGVEEKIIPANPLGRLRLERERRTKRPVMSVREEQVLTAHAPVHLQMIIRCALDTGMRRGEILGQDWRDIDFDNHMLHVTCSKTPEGEGRTVPMTGRLHNMLMAIRRDHGIVFTYEGSPIKIVKTTWASSLRRSGLRHFRFHDLRHTANSRMMLAGVLQEVRREIVGHSSQHSRDVNDRYSQIGLAELQDAIRKLEVWYDAQMRLLDNDAASASTLQPTSKDTMQRKEKTDDASEDSSPAV